jgi:hypothetical protein
MGEGELDLSLPSPIFGRGAGGEGKDLSKIGMLPTTNDKGQMIISFVAKLRGCS